MQADDIYNNPNKYRMILKSYLREGQALAEQI